MNGAKVIGMYAAIALAAFSGVYTVGSLVCGYERGATVSPFGASQPAFDAEAFNRVLSSCIAVAISLLTVWYRHAGEAQQRQADALIQQANFALEAVRKGLIEAGFKLDSQPIAAPDPPTPEAIAKRLDAMETAIEELRSEVRGPK